MDDKKVKFPKKIKVGGLIYTILYPHVFIDQPTYVGLHNGVASKIRIANTYQEYKRENQIMIETYLHELLHAVDFVYCGDTIDENILAVCARAWLQVLQDNELFLHSDKIPKKVKIGCFIYKVKYPHSSVESNKTVVASTSNDKLIISLDNNDGAEAFSPQFLKVALVNGISSAITCIYFNNSENSNNGENEDILKLKRTNFSHGLYQVLVDNKVDILIKKYMKKQV